MKRPFVRVALAFCAVAYAQTSDPVAAADLFRQGRALLESGDFPSACEKLAESARLDRRVGTLISLGQCHEGTGEIARARAFWLQAVDLARATGDARAQAAEARFAELDARVPRLTIHLPGAVPAGTIVTRDGAALGPASLGTPLALERGAHEITVSAPDREPNTLRIDLGERERRSITLVLGAERTPARPVAPTIAHLREDKPRKEAPAPSRLQRTLGYGTAGLGLAGIGVGAALGLVAKSRADASSSGCAGDVCDHDAAENRRSAIRAANASTIAFIAGTAALAGGIVLWATSPSRTPAPNISVDVGAGMFRVRGRL